MPVTNQTPIGGATGNGVTTVFPFSYYIAADTDLVVKVEGVTKTLGVDYTVSGAGNLSGGTITMTVAPANGERLAHYRDTQLKRDTDYQDNGDFLADVVNLDFDRLWLALQEIFSGGKGAPTAVRVPAGETINELPPAADRANRLLGFGSDGELLPQLPTAGDATSLALDLANTDSASKGDALTGVKRTDVANAVATTLHDWINGTTIDAFRDYEVRADGTDQTAKMLVALAAAYASLPCTLELPRGTVYCATSLGNLARSGLTIKGKGWRDSTLKFGHSGVALLVDAFQAGLTGNDATAPFVTVNLLDFTIEGNSSSTHLLQAQGVARSAFNLNAKEADSASGIAYHLKGVQLSEMQLRCSTDIQSMSSVPYEGLRMEAGTRASVSVGNSSNNLLIAPRFVGLQVGERLSGADQNLILGGAAESNGVYGLLIGSGCRYNTAICHGLENPAASNADFGDAGESTRFINGYSVKNILLQGVACEISGGFHERIEVQAGAIKNRIKDVRLNNWRTGSGGFFDSGTATEWSNLRGTTLTATFATNVMTVTAVAQGELAVGQEVVADGVSTGTTITSLGTGTGGIGTYNLSTSPGTLGSRAVSTLAYVYPLKDRTNIVVGASPFTWRNETGQYVEVVVQAGTVSQIRQLRGTDNWLKPAASPTVHMLPPLDSIEVSYSSAPTMSYVPHNGFPG
jgi:hypothetical protein